MRADSRVDELLRTLAPRVLGALVRRYGHFDTCEDAVQEAMLAAATQWPAAGLPDNPHGWLVTVANRRLVDHLRSQEARRRREDSTAAFVTADKYVSPDPDARRPARARPDGSLVPLSEQDRTLWDHDLIRQGTALITDALSQSPLGPYQLQAAIAAVHDEAARVEDTDWAQILALYQLLERISPNPMVTLNRAVALAMVHGPQAGLELLATLEGDERMVRHQRLHAVRGHLLEVAGDHVGARANYRTASRYATNLPERRYLDTRAARLANDDD